MSPTANFWADQQITGDPISKMVLLRISDNFSPTGECHKELLYLAPKCELSTEAFVFHLHRLEEQGKLQIIRHPDPTDSHPVLYRMPIPEGF